MVVVNTQLSLIALELNRGSVVYPDYTVSLGAINTGWAVSGPEDREAVKELNKITISSSDVANAVIYALNQPAKVTVNDPSISPTQQNS